MPENFDHLSKIQKDYNKLQKMYDYHCCLKRHGRKRKQADGNPGTDQTRRLEKPGKPAKFRYQHRALLEGSSERPQVERSHQKETGFGGIKVQNTLRTCRHEGPLSQLHPKRHSLPESEPNPKGHRKEVPKH